MHGIRRSNSKNIGVGRPCALVVSPGSGPEEPRCGAVAVWNNRLAPFYSPYRYRATYMYVWPVHTPSKGKYKRLYHLGTLKHRALVATESRLRTSEGAK
jgi:hypothetical protein